MPLENLALTIVLFLGVALGAAVSPFLSVVKRAGKHPILLLGPATKDLVLRYLPIVDGFIDVKGKKGQPSASVPVDGKMAYQMGSRKAFIVDTQDMHPVTVEAGQTRRLDGRRLWAIRHSIKLRKISESNNDDRTALAKIGLVALVIILVALGIAIWLLVKLWQRGGEVVPGAPA